MDGSTTDESVPRLSQTQHGQYDFRDYSVGFRSGDIVRPVCWSASLCSEVNGLFHRHGWEVYVVLRTVLDVALVMVFNLARGERVVMHFAFYAVVLAALVSEDTKESTAAGIGTAEYNYENSQIVPEIIWTWIAYEAFLPVSLHRRIH